MWLSLLTSAIRDGVLACSLAVQFDRWVLNLVVVLYVPLSYRSYIQYRKQSVHVLILTCGKCRNFVFTHISILRLSFQDHPGEPLPEENFWTLWSKGRLTQADTPTIQMGATPSGLSSAHLHHPPNCLHECNNQVRLHREQFLPWNRKIAENLFGRVIVISCRKLCYHRYHTTSAWPSIAIMGPIVPAGPYPRRWGAVTY